MEFRKTRRRPYRVVRISTQIAICALAALALAAAQATAEDVDDNPPGEMGGPGTNWENQPGPKGGPGASPDRRRSRRS